MKKLQIKKCKYCNNVIVEFNGTYWHSKTELYDKLRYDILIQRGYSVLYIDEKLYTDDPNKMVNLTVDFILTNYNNEFMLCN